MRNKILLFSVLALITAYIGYRLYSQPPRYDWSFYQVKNSFEPHGYALLKSTIHHQLKADSGQFVTVSQPIVKELHETSSGLFLSVIDTPLDSLEAIELLSFAERGNRIMFIGSTPPFLLDSVQNKYDSVYTVKRIDSSLFQVDVAVDGQSFIYERVWYDTVSSFTHQYFQPLREHPDAEYYFYLNNRPAGLRLKWGQGEIVLILMPELVDNVSLTQGHGLTFINEVLTNRLEDTVYYDQRRYIHNMNGGRSENYEESPLSYILSQPALKTAWYLGLFMILCFLAFNTKRFISAMPLRAKNKNTSVAYIETLAEMYVSRGDHISIAKKLKSQFEHEVRKIKKRKALFDFEIDMDDIVHISELSEREAKHLLELLRSLDGLEQISAEFLSTIYKRLHKFYSTIR